VCSKILPGDLVGVEIRGKQDSARLDQKIIAMVVDVQKILTCSDEVEMKLLFAGESGPILLWSTRYWDIKKIDDESR